MCVCGRCGEGTLVDVTRTAGRLHCPSCAQCARRDLSFVLSFDFCPAPPLAGSHENCCGPGEYKGQYDAPFQCFRAPYSRGHVAPRPRRSTPHANQEARCARAVSRIGRYGPFAVRQPPALPPAAAHACQYGGGVRAWLVSPAVSRRFRALASHGGCWSPSPRSAEATHPISLY